MEIESEFIGWPEELPTPLIDRQHTLQPRAQVTVMETKRKRVRRIHHEAVELLDVQWNFTWNEYEVFRAFFIEQLEQGVNLFTMETWEPAPDPSKIFIVTRRCGFIDGTYSFQRSDNLFSVGATLVVEEEDSQEAPNPYYENPIPPVPPVDVHLRLTHRDETCRDTFTLDWELPPMGSGYLPGDDLIESALYNPDDPSEEHHFFDWLRFVPTETQLLRHHASVEINNDYNGRRKFRISRGGTPVSETKIPRKAVLAVPELDIPWLEDSKYPMTHPPGRDDLTMFWPFSQIENWWLNPSPVYIEPRIRKEFRVPNLQKYEPFIEDGAFNIYEDSFAPAGWQSLSRFEYYGTLWPTNVVTATSPDDGVEIRWTTDGTDPTLDMIWPPPKINGEEMNANLIADEFALVIKARCFKGGCKSPLLTIIIDKRYETVITTQVIGEYSGAVAANLLSYRVFDPVQGWIDIVPAYPGLCGEVYNPSDAWSCLETLFPCGYQATVGSKLGNDLRWIVNGNLVEASGNSYTPGFVEAIISFYNFSLTALNIIREPEWDKRPTHAFVYIYAEGRKALYWGATEKAGDNHKTIGNPGDNPGPGIAGVGGVTSYIASKGFDLVIAYTYGCFSRAFFYRFDLIQTIYLEGGPAMLPSDLVAHPPVTPPPPPTPQPIDFVPRDNFQSYPEDGDVSVLVLDGGIGWKVGSQWIAHSLAITEGEELWQYEGHDGVLLDTALEIAVNQPTPLLFTGGEGWAAGGHWVFSPDPSHYIYEELWEDYADAVLDPTILTLNQGVGWVALSYWRIKSYAEATYGEEGWEDYIDGILPITGVTLNQGIGWITRAWAIT